MAKIQPEVGAAPHWGGLLAVSAALALAACLWLALSPPALAAGMEWQTYLSEDFSGTESMFYTGKAGEANYNIDDQGRYVINGLDTDSDSLSALTDSMYYYYVEASCQLVSSDAKNLAFVGLVFHYKKQDDGTLAYYVFYIYGDGYYGAKRVIGDKVDIALPLTKSDEIDVGAANVLAVEAQGSRFDLYINGKHVDGFTDLKLDGGGFGFYISKRSEGAFDNFKVKVEKRDTGQEPPQEPNSATDSGPTKLTSYSPPYIPKDPDRPVYPWEVGVDKGKKGKGKKPAEPADKGARVEDTNGPGDSGADHPETKQPDKKKTAGPKKVDASKVKPGDKKVEQPAAPRKVEAKPKPDHKDTGAGQDAGQTPEPKGEPPPPKEQPQPGSDSSRGSAAAPSVVILPPADMDSADAAPKDQAPAPAEPSPEPAAPLTDISQAQSEPQAAEPEAPAPSSSELSIPSSEPDQSAQPEPEHSELQPQPEPEQQVAQREAVPGKPADDKQAKPFIRVEKSPKAEKPKPGKKGKATASKPAADPGEGMRGRQDDWADPNSDSAVVEEVHPPAPAPKDSPGKKNKQEVPKQDAVKLELPPAPAPADDKASTEDLSLLPPADDSAAPAAAPVTPEVPAGEPAKPQATESTKLDDLPPVEHGKAPAAGFQSPPAPPVEPEPPAVVQDVSPPAPALDLPPAPADTPPQAPVPPSDPNTVQIDDDFSQPHWAVAESPSCTYRYFGAAYEINNLNSATMALSFQQETLANVETACDVEFLDGVSYVGYGLAARFSAKDGVPTYYGLFVCQSGEFMLLRVIGGKETVLEQWTASAQLKPNQPNRIKLVLAGAKISAYLNDVLVATVDDDAIASGGYALLAGPGVSARFDNFSLRGTR